MKIKIIIYNSIKKKSQQKTIIFLKKYFKNEIKNLFQAYDF